LGIPLQIIEKEKGLISFQKKKMREERIFRKRRRENRKIKYVRYFYEKY
jgi:hypothetical protein